MDDKLQNRQVNRRRLLRRAGTVAAGVAGAGVASAVVATPAQAATTAFTNNTGDAAAASFQSTFSSSELIAGKTYQAVGPQIQLQPLGGTDILSAAAPQGSIAMDQNGFIWVATGVGSRDFIHTTNNSNLTVPIAPTRAWDSANLPGRLINSTAITGGKLKARYWAFIDLTDFVSWGQGAFIGVVSVAAPAAGFLSVGPYVGQGQPAPTWSNLNFNANVNTNTMTFTAIGGDLAGPYPTDVIAIYANVSTRIIIDAYAFVVDSRGRVNPAVLGGSALTSNQSQYEKRLAQIAQQPKV